MSPRRKPLNAVPTLVDVAKLAGVGLGTASRALSGTGYVSEKTSERIRAISEQLGYKRNEIARSLKVKRTGAIGLVIPDIGGPFMATCVCAIQKVLRQSGYISIITFTEGSEKIESEEIDYLIRHQIDGLIVVPSESSAAHFQSAHLAHIPVVAFDQPILSAEYDAVLVKNRHGAREAVKHLIEHGHRRIGCIAVNRQLDSMQKRVEGYRDAMRQAGLQPLVEFTTLSDDGVGKLLDKWLALDSPPTAIFSLNELTSLETVEAFAVRGLSMPGQMAFIGFDDIQLGPYLNPPLTSVVQPACEMGECAAGRLLTRLEAAEDLPVERILLDAQLVVRGSCGCPVTKK